ncbi:hypothetical protein RQM59_03780 [Flavobacteriaceae bacterium S356]|uniref:Lipoprotein n=1 Tax=Asprobacillus argus TaxID=3076534 RepID=A0ABU3LCN6_9FLAO|nr:hypothetical protein [Flavobacteriaceae bacterium S356]
MKKRRLLNINGLVAGSALFISACALFLSIQEVRIMRTQQKASMYPYLTYNWTYTGEGFGIELKNSGNGLAKITSYKVFNDSIYFRDWIDVLKHYMPEAKTIGYATISTSGNIRDQMISPGETKQLIFIKWNEESRVLETKTRNLKISICYSSLLDEHWAIQHKIPKQIEKPLPFLIEQEFGF